MSTKAYYESDLTEQIIGSAIAVHKALGPGLMESAYEQCLCHEMNCSGLQFRRQVRMPVEYRGVKLDCGYRIDLMVADRVIIEIKSVRTVLPVHKAQLLTYLRLSGKQVGLILNFNVTTLRDGIVRKVLSKEHLLEHLE